MTNSYSPLEKIFHEWIECWMCDNLQSMMFGGSRMKMNCLGKNWSDQFHGEDVNFCNTRWGRVGIGVSNFQTLFTLENTREYKDTEAWSQELNQFQSLFVKFFTDLAGIRPRCHRHPKPIKNVKIIFVRGLSTAQRKEPQMARLEIEKKEI